MGLLCTFDTVFLAAAISTWLAERVIRGERKSMIILIVDP